jgi:transposase-like protein
MTFFYQTFFEVDPINWTVSREVKELFSVLLSLNSRGIQKMSKKRRNHSPEFKSKVALVAIKGDKTLSELSQQYGVNGNLIVKWKKQLMERSAEVFASGKGLAPDRESEIQSLQAKIGQLTMENDFLAKVLDR